MHFRQMCSLAVGSFMYSGAVFEGLNLLSQEVLHANYLADRTASAAVIGDGAGWSMQALANGSGSLGWFPPSGDVGAAVSMMQSVCRMHETDRSRLRERDDVLPRRARSAHARKPATRSVTRESDTHIGVMDVERKSQMNRMALLGGAVPRR
jgi:hypothetical protein